MPRPKVRRHAALLTVTGLSLLIGCQLLVPSDLPEFRCLTSNPSACPSGTLCDPVSLLCVNVIVVADARSDATDSSPDSGPRIDAGPQLGAECVVDDDCKVGPICGTSTLLTTEIVPSNSKPICTRTCCTSEDCPSGFVCFGTGTGGNYCVAASKAGRTLPATGGKGPGDTCVEGSDCRSGLCAGRCANVVGQCSKDSECTTGSCSLRCADTCCGDSTCGTSTCRIETIATHVIWACAAPNPSPAKDTGISQTCAATTDCKNDNCVFGTFPNKRCTPTCCKSADCAAMGFTNNVCAYGNNGNDQIKWCFEPSAGTTPNGADCQVATDCASRFCDSALRKCAAVCCTDSDCGVGEVCRPSPVNTPYLRCVPKP